MGLTSLVSKLFWNHSCIEIFNFVTLPANETEDKHKGKYYFSSFSLNPESGLRFVNFTRGPQAHLSKNEKWD
jgi:hypothetical protein